MANVLILGGGGMLGHQLCRDLPRLGFQVSATLRGIRDWQHEFPEVYGKVHIHPGINVLEMDSLRRAIDIAQPESIVNCVGLIKQRPEAEDKALAVAINAHLPHLLAQVCAETGRRLIHISTDCVFDGARGAYQEADLTNAVDLYGRSKALGETTALETAAVTLRTSLIGPELVTPKHGLFEWFLSQRGGRARGYSRAIFSGFTTFELTRIIARVIRQPGLRGLYHVASAPISKFDLLSRINEVCALGVKLERDDLFTCDRSLVMDRFSQETGYTAPGWDVMIDELRNRTCH